MGVRPLRTFWKAIDLDEPETGTLWGAILRYRQAHSRWRVSESNANLISSKSTVRGIHLPLIDLDIDHMYLASTTPGRAHIYLNEAIPTWRWVVLMIGLRVGRVTEQGYFVWSLRRGGNFVRLPHVRKVTPVEFRPTFGARNPTHG